VSPGLAAAQVDSSYSFDGSLTALEITLGIGLLLFLVWDRLHTLLHHIHWLDRYGAAALYEHALHGLTSLAAWHTRLLQHGQLTGYLRLTLTSLLAMGAFAWVLTDSRVLLQWDWPDHAWAWAVACLLIVAGAAAAMLLRDRLAILMASGLVGYGSAVLFLFAGAPDLAFTQFAVETVLVVVAASVLPRYGPASPRHEPWPARE
jgi:multicomponent Na+:H+ antiporter subunit A